MDNLINDERIKKEVIFFKFEKIHRHSSYKYLFF